MLHKIGPYTISASAEVLNDPDPWKVNNEKLGSLSVGTLSEGLRE